MGTNHMDAPVLERQMKRLGANKDGRIKKSHVDYKWKIIFYTQLNQ